MTAALHLHSVLGETVSPARTERSSGIVPRFNDDDWLAAELGREGIDLAQLSYGLSSPRTGVGAPLPVLEDMYRFWSNGQGSLSTELGTKWSLTSDEFSRQDEWACMSYGGECIGLSAFRFVQAEHPFVRDDSYFRSWPEATRQKLFNLGSRICVGSNITVAPTWRGRFGEFSVKEMLLSLAIERFLASDADIMAGTMRNARGMNSLGYRLGARSLENDYLHPHYGVAVDLVVFDREPRPTQPTDVCTALTDYLWTHSGSEGANR